MNASSTYFQYLASVIAEDPAVSEVVFYLGFDTDIYALLLTALLYLLLYLLLQFIGMAFSFVKEMVQMMGQPVGQRFLWGNRIVRFLKVFLLSIAALWFVTFIST